jgi:hypothetical protein
MQPMLLVAITSGLMLSMFRTLRSRSRMTISG